MKVLKFKQFLLSINESTDYDNIFLGEKLIDISQLIPSLKYEDLSGILHKVVVAMDIYNIGDENKYDYSIGSLQGYSPRGIMFGDFHIEKWRNLSKSDKENLDGILISLDKEEYVLWFNFPNF